MVFLCPICAGEFDSGTGVCPSCGCGLIASSLEDGLSLGSWRVEKDIRYAELCRPRDYSLAMLIKETLERYDVAVLVQGGHSLSVLPHLAFGGELRVLVEASQLNYARELYRAYFEGEESDFSSEEWPSRDA